MLIPTCAYCAGCCCMGGRGGATKETGRAALVVYMVGDTFVHGDMASINCRRRGTNLWISLGHISTSFQAIHLMRFTIKRIILWAFCGVSKLVGHMQYLFLLINHNHSPTWLWRYMLDFAISLPAFQSWVGNKSPCYQSSMRKELDANCDHFKQPLLGLSPSGAYPVLPESWFSEKW